LCWIAHVVFKRSADVIDFRVAEVQSGAGDADGRPADVVDNCQSSAEVSDVTGVTTVRLACGDGGRGGDQPDWLTVRRRYLDNQILRRELRCQRAEALVSEQFSVVIKK